MPTKKAPNPSAASSASPTPAVVAPGGLGLLEGREPDADERERQPRALERADVLAGGEADDQRHERRGGRERGDHAHRSHRQPAVQRREADQLRRARRGRPEREPGVGERAAPDDRGREHEQQARALGDDEHREHRDVAALDPGEEVGGAPGEAGCEREGDGGHGPQRPAAALGPVWLRLGR
jgi:hypothetical protein